jgi:integrating conjugative element protein (TIGR03749 family)
MKRIKNYVARVCLGLLAVPGLSMAQVEVKAIRQPPPFAAEKTATDKAATESPARLPSMESSGRSAIPSPSASNLGAEDLGGESTLAASSALAASSSSIVPAQVMGSYRSNAQPKAAKKQGVLHKANASELASSGALVGAQHLEFKDRPLAIALQVGKERMVSFPGQVEVHVPRSLEGLVRVQIIGRTAYIMALKPFSSTRFPVQDLGGEPRWYPLDVVASNTSGQDSSPIEIHVPGATDEGEASGSKSDPDSAPDMVMLTRYAAHMLYAPRRLAPKTPGMRQVPIESKPVLGLYRGRRIQTVPVGAWRAGALFVTAVRFTNLESEPVELNLDELRGAWLAATSQHGRIAQAGHEADTTAVYLVCDKPFEACR